ncbi:uncharacterized protein LOC119677522 [Teleopsis dalmanni]|uniref:uncharacterized protein LOC119677521 n=1 Tax=Teleopsis dalmanni TaxID=139649 RepID=UPI0018CD3473|nr:uncharacterized protein LOC119677521 [Teleopsis dalmanni]XP_037944826.1 uncharacterized protein LOC119677522 [Teleopsis dalmanni]
MSKLNSIFQEPKLSAQMSDPYIKCPKRRVFVLTNEQVINEILPDKTCSEIEVFKTKKRDMQKILRARYKKDEDESDECDSIENAPQTPRPIRSCPYVQLNPSDEISVSSIFSEILSLVLPTEKEIKDLKWEVKAKDMSNDKQCMLFPDYMHIFSVFDGAMCQLKAKEKIELEVNEVQRIGKLKFEVEETTDGYYVHSWSEMHKERGSNTVCGHELKGKYDNKFRLVVERRMEYNPLNNATVIKRLMLRNVDYKKIVATREICLNDTRTTYSADIDIRGRPEPFIGDGGITALVRFLVINKFFGDYELYSMSLFGKVVRVVLNIFEERHTMRIFTETFRNLFLVKKTEYFDDEEVEVSESYLTAKGKLILHFWPTFNYILHCSRPIEPPKEMIIPRLEFQWKQDSALYQYYISKEKLYRNLVIEYLKESPEVKVFLRDYMRMMVKLKPKPTDVFRYTVEFFSSFAYRPIKQE